MLQQPAGRGTERNHWRSKAPTRARTGANEHKQDMPRQVGPLKEQGSNEGADGRERAQTGQAKPNRATEGERVQRGRARARTSATNHAKTSRATEGARLQRGRGRTRTSANKSCQTSRATEGARLQRGRGRARTSANESCKNEPGHGRSKAPTRARTIATKTCQNQPGPRKEQGSNEGADGRERAQTNHAKPSRATEGARLQRGRGRLQPRHAKTNPGHGRSKAPTRARTGANERKRIMQNRAGPRKEQGSNEGADDCNQGMPKTTRATEGARLQRGRGWARRAQRDMPQEHEQDMPNHIGRAVQRERERERERERGQGKNNNMQNHQPSNQSRGQPITLGQGRGGRIADTNRSTIGPLAG